MNNFPIASAVSIEDVPNIARLAEDTVELLGVGSDASDNLRRKLAERYGIGKDAVVWPRFVNNHAWALVRLQQQGTIRKLKPGLYALISATSLITPSEIPTPPIRDGKPLPRWARQMVARATQKNLERWQAAPFREADLRKIWSDGGGACLLTGRPFAETRIGTGQAKRPYAPSLDRIDSEKPYTSHNCRLVLQAVNFALNAYGDEIFEEITESAVRHRSRRCPARAC